MKTRMCILVPKNTRMQTNLHPKSVGCRSIFRLHPTATRPCGGHFLARRFFSSGRRDVTAGLLSHPEQTTKFTKGGTPIQRFSDSVSSRSDSAIQRFSPIQRFSESARRFSESARRFSDSARRFSDSAIQSIQPDSVRFSPIQSIQPDSVDSVDSVD